MKRLWAAGLGAALLAAGCGGGGDGGGPTPVQLPAPVAITTTNQNQVASATANVFFGLGTTSGVVPLSSGGRVTAAALPGSNVVFKASAATVAAAKAAAVDSRVTTQAVIPIDLGIVCTSGSVSSTLDDSNNNGQADLGEPVTVVFTNCADGGDVFNGQMTITITSIGAGGQQINANLGFSNLRGTTSEGSATLNGGLSIAIALQTGGVVDSTLTVGINGMTSTVAATSFSDTLTFGSGLTMTLRSDPLAVPPGGGTPGRDDLSVSGSVGSAALNGSFTISTPAAIVKYIVDNYPRSGQVISTGANGSKLRLTVLDATTVRLEVDANGDGTYESTTTRAWSDIL